MVCVVLKVREDNGRKPMRFLSIDAEGGLRVGRALFRRRRPCPPPPGDATPGARSLLKDWRLKRFGDWSWGISHEERLVGTRGL